MKALLSQKGCPKLRPKECYGSDLATSSGFPILKFLRWREQRKDVHTHTEAFIVQETTVFALKSRALVFILAE